MGEIAGKFVDALSMFWQALDDEERRMLVFGACWLAAVVVNVPLEQRRRQRERDEIAAQVVAELRGGANG